MPPFFPVIPEEGYNNPITTETCKHYSTHMRLTALFTTQTPNCK
jgi:hypothetical protein